MFLRIVNRIECHRKCLFIWFSKFRETNMGEAITVRGVVYGEQHPICPLRWFRYSALFVVVYSSTGAGGEAKRGEQVTGPSSDVKVSNFLKSVG